MFEGIWYLTTNTSTSVISLFLCVLNPYAYLLYVFTFYISMFIEQFVSITHKTYLSDRLQKQEVEVSVGLGFILLLKESVVIMSSLKVWGRKVEHSRCWKGYMTEKSEAEWEVTLRGWPQIKCQLGCLKHASPWIYTNRDPTITKENSDR